VGSPNGTGRIFGGGIGQRNVTYKKHAALRCECSVPAAELLDSSAVGIAQIVAHAAGESILCREVWWRGSSQVTLGRTCYNVVICVSVTSAIFRVNVL